MAPEQNDGNASVPSLPSEGLADIDPPVEVNDNIQPPQQLGGARRRPASNRVQIPHPAPIGGPANIETLEHRNQRVQTTLFSQYLQDIRRPRGVGRITREYLLQVLIYTLSENTHALRERAAHIDALQARVNALESGELQPNA